MHVYKSSKNKQRNIQKNIVLKLLTVIRMFRLNYYVSNDIGGRNICGQTCTSYNQYIHLKMTDKCLSFFPVSFSNKHKRGRKQNETRYRSIYKMKSR